MKKFKQFDWWINLSLMIVFTIMDIIKGTVEFLILSYFIVGGWQVISMLVHRFNGWFLRKGSHRSCYHWVVVTIFALVGLSLAIPPFLIVFYFLLLGSPFLAIWYTIICFDEMAFLRKRRELSLT